MPFRGSADQDRSGAGGFGGGGAGGAGHGGGGGGFSDGDGSGYSPKNKTDVPDTTGGTSFLTTAALMGAISSAEAENSDNAGNGKVVIRAICYVTGTLICTANGDVAVEALKIGDEVVTASGARRPIRWLGHRTLRRSGSPRDALPRDAWPIRIAAQAFGDNSPARDLFVSPGHAICVDLLGEVLIPAGALANGSTIRPVEVDEVTYWHVELDDHDILLAENLACESYLDMGNRDFFAEADVVSLAAGPDGDPAQRSHADFCRPFFSDGPLVTVARQQLVTRAHTLGWTLDAADPLGDLHLLVDGVRVPATTRRLTARFSVPARATEIWLVSETARPCEVTGSQDARDLGVSLRRLTVDDGFGTSRDIDLADPLLCIGFHAHERTHRWTAGRAFLPAALWADGSESFFLRVELAGPVLPRWIPPAVADLADVLVTGQIAATWSIGWS